MGKIFEEIDDKLAAWVGRQKMFFVASAPATTDGHINCSPKGIDSLRILGSRQIAYLDITGSGAETIAHVRENQRIVIMLCAFEGPPNIVRFHGKGEVVEPADPEFDTLAESFDIQASTRAIIRIDVTRISDSCGFGVPLYDFKADRDIFDSYAKRKGPEGLRQYRAEKNRVSIDGLPALKHF